MSTPPPSVPTQAAPANVQDKVLAAISADVPHLYATGFNFGITSNDVLVAFEVNGAPQCVLNMSYGLAKELASKLAHQIQKVETDTGITFVTPSEMDVALAAARAKKN